MVLVRRPAGDLPVNAVPPPQLLQEGDESLPFDRLVKDHNAIYPTVRRNGCDHCEVTMVKILLIDCLVGMLMRVVQLRDRRLGEDTLIDIQDPLVVVPCLLQLLVRLALPCLILSLLLWSGSFVPGDGLALDLISLVEPAEFHCRDDFVRKPAMIQHCPFYQGPASPGLQYRRVFQVCLLLSLKNPFGFVSLTLALLVKGHTRADVLHLVIGQFQLISNLSEAHVGSVVLLRFLFAIPQQSHCFFDLRGQFCRRLLCHGGCSLVPVTDLPGY